MSFKHSRHLTILLFCLIMFLSPFANGQLYYNFYDRSCPKLQMIVKFGVWEAVKNDARMAASLLRVVMVLCFLMTQKISKGEKNASPNRNSARGYEVIDKIKADVERACPITVSCVDILTLVAREAVVQSEGLPWPVPLGRRDGLTASEKAANEQLPSPFEPLENITGKFASKGLDLKDVVVLSGAHTIGFAQCFTFKRRLFNFTGSGKPDPTLDSSLLSSLRSTCPNIDGSNSQLAPLDSATSSMFDNAYYKNLASNSGLLQSDQALMGDPRTSAMVNSYSMYPFLFSKDFGESMVKLGYVGILTGQNGEIRKKCGSVN